MARHPIMREIPSRTIRVPDLSGGLNTRDSLSMINDNQLTDCLNVWWRDGVLKTRPGLKHFGTVPTVSLNENIEPRQTDIFIGEYRLFYSIVEGEKNTTSAENPEHTVRSGFTETVFWFQNANQIINLSPIEGSVSFVCQVKNCIYAFVDGTYKIYKRNVLVENNAIKSLGSWELIAESDVYVPTVYTHCLVEDGGNFSGVPFEGFNLIGNKFKIVYSTVNPNVTPIGDMYFHEMYYPFPDTMITNPNEYIGKEVKVTIRDENGKETIHTATFENLSLDGTYAEGREKYYHDAVGDDRLTMEISTKGINFVIYQGVNGYDDPFFDPARIAFGEVQIEDNLEIIMPYVPTPEEKARVFGMRECTWFGGDAAGISGGTRLFLGGNKNETEKALVVWSGLNNPLYFSENCYAYVGNETQAVTGFGKQADTLVIFKEPGAGTFYTQHTKASDISASDLINQSVVDYAASTVYFPIITLHPTIGCDCPKTIQLCRNRLVWACSDGNVYTISSQNQYSERNVYIVSDMISRKLKGESNLKNAVSADWEGHYLLFAQNNVYVMDYESYGYAYIASHTKAENAQTKIPWWYWQLPDGDYHSDKVCSVLQTDNRLFVVFYDKTGLISQFTINQLSPDYKDDNSKPISSALQTKLFDFSLPAHKKNIGRVDLTLGNNGGAPISVEFITENGSESQEIILEGNETQSYTAGYVNNRAVFPCIKAVGYFGVKLSCNGNIATDSLSLNYKVLGGIR